MLTTTPVAAEPGADPLNALFWQAVAHERAGNLTAMVRDLEQIRAECRDQGAGVYQNSTLKLANHFNESLQADKAMALLLELFAQQGPDVPAVCRANQSTDPGFALVTLMRLCNTLGLHAQLQHLLKHVLPSVPVARHRLPDLAELLRRTGYWGPLRNLEAQMLEQYRSPVASQLSEPSLTHLGWCEDEIVNGRQARVHAQQLRAHVPAVLPPPGWPSQRPARLRIGYVTATLYGHAFMQLAREVLAAHDSTRFDIHWFNIGPRDDSWWVQDALRDAAGVHDLRRHGDQAAAAYIRALDVDVLIDHMGWTRGHRQGILARRPARVQANWLGYCGPIGADWMDYNIADEDAVPAAATSCYVEQLAWMPRTYFPADGHPRIASRATSRSDWGLPDDGLVLCVFQQAIRINEAIWSLWMRVLAQRSDAVLWIITDSPLFQDNIARAARQQGVDPARLVWASRVPIDQHLERLRHADLALDTPVYGACTTAVNALTMAVPLLGLQGGHWASRISAGLLEQAGLPDFVTHSVEAYEERLLALTQQREELRRARLRLADRSKLALFDSTRFCREFEALIDAMWEARRAGIDGPVRVSR